jgi:hypothetical protein
MGVPITFLDKYNPEEFAILGITSGRNEFDKDAWPTKRYIAPKQHNPNGTVTNGGKVNTGAEILLNDIPEKQAYYTADNASGPLRSIYKRILIRNLHPIKKADDLGY